jgi:site-specific DNA recombinase
LQEQACIERAKLLKLRPEVYSDIIGHSTGTNEERDAWQRCKARLCDPDVAALIVYTWARAVRNVKLLLGLVDLCKTNGVRLVSVSQSIDTGTADGRAFLTITAAFDELEPGRASERRLETIDDLRRHHGRFYGHAPFGTERVQVGGDLILFPSTKQQPNGTDHACLTQLYTLYVSDGLSYERVAARLNSDGWKCRGEKGDKLGQLRAWNAFDVRRCVENHWLYSGYVTVGRAYRDMSEILKGSHAPILPDALTAAVAARKESTRKNGIPAHAPHAHALTGVLCCPAGCKLSGHTIKGVRLYRHGAPCPASIERRYNADDVEMQVRQHIASVKIPRDLLAQETSNVNKIIAAEHDGGVEAERRRIAESLERAKELYIDGDLTKAEYEARKAALQADMPPTGPQLAPELVGLQAVQAAILASTVTTLRMAVRSLYVAITITPDGLEFSPKTWCPWA